MTLPTRALEILRADGVRQLAKKTASYPMRKAQKRFFQLYLFRTALNTEALQESAANRGRIWYSDPEPPIEYTFPRQSEGPPELARYTGTQQPTQPFICEMPSCTLFGPTGAVFSDRGELIVETTGGSIELALTRYGDIFGRNPIASLFDTSAESNPNLRDVSHVFPLVPVRDRYYYHWILLHLPKLRLLELYERKTGIKPVILIEENPPSFVTESLSLLGYGVDRRAEWTGGKERVANVVIADHRVHSTALNTYDQSPMGYSWLRNELCSQGTEKESNKHLFISRQEADRGRKVANYDEVVAELESRGVEPVTLESLPMREQIDLVSGADTVIGPHGAGLANMIFAEDPTVIELFPDSVVRPHFSLLADVMGFEYRSIVAESTDNDDLHVDVGTLREVLRESDI